MRKVFFLFLLSLSVCVAVNIKAQVRIGGDNAPHLSAVLDLNPSDTADAKGGVLLPRVRLDSVEDSAVFGATVTLERGLVVYNLNGNEAGRPPEGVYCYDGEEWLLIGGAGAKDEGGELDYQGPGFLISTTPKVLWLGRDGELGEQWDVIMPDLSGYAVKYVWYFVDTVTQQEVTSYVVTNRPALQIPIGQQDEIKRGKVYRLFCAVRVGKNNYETERVDAGKVVYGTGAWIGQEEWLNVANANVGGDQSLTLQQQLSEDHMSAYNRKVMGDRFQWGRSPDGHEIAGSESLNEIVPVSMLDPITGQAKDKYIGKFITADGGGDWRLYPTGMPTNELRKNWYWRTMEEPDTGVDPCSPAMGTISGEWFVMTRSQWNLIRENNRLAWLSTVNVRGVAVYPGNSDNPSFYIPMGNSRMHTGSFFPSNWDSNSWYTCLWLNSLLTDLTKADMLEWSSSGSEWDVSQPHYRIDGAPIRCVSK